MFTVPETFTLVVVTVDRDDGCQLFSIASKDLSPEEIDEVSQKAWRRYRAARQLKAAVVTIEDAWLKRTYAPGGSGASRAAKRFRMSAN